MIVFGVLFIFSFVSGTVTILTYPLTSRLRNVLELLFPKTGVDLKGDGKIDFYKPRHPLIYYFKNLLPSFILNLIVQFASARSEALTLHDPQSVSLSDS